MCNLYSITTNQAAIIALFRVVNRYDGNLAPMPGVFAGIWTTFNGRHDQDGPRRGSRPTRPPAVDATAP
jgi:hypothetical protein